MNIDNIPMVLLFLATIFVVIIGVEIGHWLGYANRRREKEKESSVSAVATAIVGLTGFMLAFTFGIVTNRYDARKELLRQEVNAISTAYLRSEFLPQEDRSKAAKLYRDYVYSRLSAFQSRDFSKIQKVLSTSAQIQRELWDMAAMNARQNMNSDVAALYIESLNEMIDLNASRVNVGLHARIPLVIWFVLYILVVLGMIGVGYQSAIVDSSSRSRVMYVLSIAFSLVIALLLSLDRPQSGFITVSNQPLVDLHNWIEEDFKIDSGLEKK